MRNVVFNEQRPRRCQRRTAGVIRRRGLTLAELLVSGVIMALIAATLAALATAVQTHNDHNQGQSIATQHARVTLHRIERTVREAYANEQFPGCAVFAETAAGWSFPDTLVVWSPAVAPVNPDGLPLFSEIVVFCPDDRYPHRLLEITDPDDHRSVPPLSDSATWSAELAGMKTRLADQAVQLTDLLRVGSEVVNAPSTHAGPLAIAPAPASERGVIRFELEINPSLAEWQDYQDDVLIWDELTWPLDIVGSQTGMRHVRCRVELHLMPGELAFQTDARGQTSIPFFGSASLHYQLQKKP